MEKLKNFYHKHFFFFVAAWLIVVAAFVFWLGGVLETNQFERTIDNATIQANKAVQEATNANNAAVNASIERRLEDAVREKVITPKLEQARRRSQNSKAELEKTQNELENAKTNLSNLNRSIADNCSELKRLYPNTRFEYCQQR